MLAISKSSEESVAINILPCRINHDGPTKVTKRYWQPRKETDGSQTAYFRGRRLRGRTVRLPENFQGLILKSSDKTIVEAVAPAMDSDDDDEPELPEVIKVVEQVASFDEMQIWGHDATPATDESFVKGVEEWIAFAEAIHAR